MTPIERFAMYVAQESHPLTNSVHDITENELEFLAISNALGGEMGELQNIVKKIMRSDVYHCGGLDLWNEFILEAGDVLHYYNRLLQNAGYSIEEVINANIHKLEDRKLNASQTNTVSTTPAESRT
jgi:NTP pyrophosphatase (non-canonical NTP hydrolase)